MRASFLGLLMPLRVAVRLHRSRSDEVLPEFRFEASKDCLTVVGPIGWREAYPLTEDNLLAEARSWRDHPLELELEEA